MDSIQLTSKWTVGEPLGSGGFGEVFRVTCGEQSRALKLVPKTAGADRELLFSVLEDAVNVVPVLEIGETDTHWALLMPLADRSLRELLTSEGAQPVERATRILMDVAEALASISGQVVHRDIKPENVLMLDGKWCLADFGIARYAEATTDAETRKYALTAAYSAPERWRFERATPATDIYSLGVIAYELLLDQLPFPGPSSEDFRDQHLHGEAIRLAEVPTSLAAVVEECLYKAPEARPSAANVLARLSKASEESLSESRSRLSMANLLQVRENADADRKRSAALTEHERRSALGDVARLSLEGISDALREVISADAPLATVSRTPRSAWEARLGGATLALSALSAVNADPWNWEAPAFDVIASASIAVTIPQNRNSYKGRSHSLWYCDPVEEGCFKWYETAFMISALMQQVSAVNPFALAPGENAAKALWAGMAEYQLAWPFEPIESGDLQQFVDRWIGWFADAATNKLGSPSRMPERDTGNSWRRE